MAHTLGRPSEDHPFSRGSIWRKWDFHLHTPSSFDYANKTIANEAIVNVLTTQSIAAAVITDHHVIDVGRIRRLQELAGDKVTFFPGIELRTELGGKESIHMVGLFAESADLDHVWTTLQGRLDLTEATVKAKGHESIYVDFKAAANAIHELGGVVSVHAGKKSNSIENISNAEIFKQAVKQDLARTHIDILEIGRVADAADYEGIVFPKIKNVFPLVIGSDNHDAGSYALKVPTWIRSDTTFEGLRQILNEPRDRIHRGDLPPLLQRVAQNKTKYINQVTIAKSSDAKLEETWFDCSVPLNPGLVAIIGNKGSGKSALSDTIGLLGGTRHSASFSFLNEYKFRQPKNNKARHFRAQMTWESGTSVERGLAEEVDQTAVETVKYIPQNYLETVCNELRAGGDTRFDHELKAVIYSHVKPADRLEAETLDQLIEYKTQETYAAIDLVRVELTETNKEIAAMEAMLTEEYKRSLEAQLAEKQRELTAHAAAKPVPVSKPDLDPTKQAEMAGLGKIIEDAQTKLIDLDRARSGLLEEQTVLTRQAALVTKLFGKVENFIKQYQVFKADYALDCQELSVNPEEVVKVVVDTSRLTAVQNKSKLRMEQITNELDPGGSGVASMIAATKSGLDQTRAMLDAPNQEYQKYLAALEEWKKVHSALVGDDCTPGTLSYLQNQLKSLDVVPSNLAEACELRRLKANEIFEKIQSLTTLYETLYRPVREFIEHHPLAKDGLKLDFKVSLVETGFEEGFFALVSQGKKGSFCGIEEGRQVLKSLLQQADWNSSPSVFEFLENIRLRLSQDFRQDKRPAVRVEEQLKREASVVGIYDHLFALAYLKPKYHLQWGGRDLDELSPGERGTVLLLFYLLLDSSSIPLVIDQPEENLDNQTVFSVLVPAIKEARTRRQIVIVTHNPNLAVVCDADQVIYAQLDKAAGNKVTYESGSIENPRINRRIIDVLEGTRPAFENRDAKYQKPK